MDTNEMLLKLEQYKAKLDAGEDLTPEEQAELEAIAQYVAEAIKAFVTVLQEAFRPAIEVVAKALKELWDSLPKELQQYLSQPQRVTINNVAQQQAPSSIFVPQRDSEARTAQHYSGRGGW